MWRRAPTAHRQHCRYLHFTRACQRSNIIEIENASFYRHFPSSQDVNRSNPALFSGLNFSLATTQKDLSEPQFWSVVSASSVARTTFLQILAAQHICIPPTARRYPYLSESYTSLQHALKYVGFDADRGTSVGGTNVRGAYLSARYESRREETDFSLRDYLLGQTELNALETEPSVSSRQALDEVVARLNLHQLLNMPVANLSNGQTRRARIAKALMARPEVLLLDGPFMGLDPNTRKNMDSVLHQLAANESPRLVMSLRPEDGVPQWVSHLIVADENLNVLAQGPKTAVLQQQGKCNALQAVISATNTTQNGSPGPQLSRDAFPMHSPALDPGEVLVEMQGVRVAYGERVVLGDWSQSVNENERTGLWWNLRRGQRCGIFGANGSGKTTMLSLITSDHPQTYSLPIKLFGRSRLPGPGEPGISLFDIQRRMGHSSPEVHAFFPKQLTVRRALESAWADAPLSRPQLNDSSRQRVSAVLRWFASELNPRANESSTLEKLGTAYNAASNAPEEERHAALRSAYDALTSHDCDLGWSIEVRFGELSFTNQRLILFLRAIIAQPDLVILDEALSGVDEQTRNRALLFLSHGESCSRVDAGVRVPSLLSQIQQVAFAGLSPEQALLVISHAREEVPGCVREWICLPEPGEGRSPRAGVLQGPLELNAQGWDEIWGSSHRR